MVKAIIEQTDENQKYQLAVYDHLQVKNRKVWCECCGDQGHKFYECPERLLGKQSNIFCSACGSSNHPKSDCPELSKFPINKLFLEKKKGIVEEVTPEEELHNFLTDIRKDKE